MQTIVPILTTQCYKYGTNTQESTYPCVQYLKVMYNEPVCGFTVWLVEWGAGGHRAEGLPFVLHLVHVEEVEFLHWLGQHLLLNGMSNRKVECSKQTNG